MSSEGSAPSAAAASTASSSGGSASVSASSGGGGGAAAESKTILAQIQEFLDNIDRFLDKYPTAQQVKAKGVRPAYIAVGVTSAVLLFVLFGVGAAAVCNLTGFVYPLYASFKAVNSPQQDDDTQWLTYWIV